MKHLTAILIALVISPITALMSAATMSKLWEWYVVRDYGAGPSYASWFGLSVILGIAIGPSLMNVAEKPVDEKVSPIARVIVRTLSVWIAFPIVLFMAWVVGFALHWH